MMGIGCCKVKKEVLKKVKKIIAGIFLICLIIIALWQSFFLKEAEIGLEKGNKAPDFELLTLEGEKVSISDFEGKNVILNFWATWCKPCEKEMPELEKVYQQNKDEVTVVAVNFTVSEKNVESVQSYIKQGGYTFPVLLDQKNKANSGFEVLSYPTTYFLDENGIIRDKVIGQMTDEIIENKLKKLK